jgi:hypothetical protein
MEPTETTEREATPILLSRSVLLVVSVYSVL